MPLQNTKKPAGEPVLRRIICSFLMLYMVFMLPHEVLAKAAKKSGSVDNPKYAAIVTDAASGEVLFERNGNKILHPASLTKVMTLLLLFEALESGNVRLSDRISISQHAASQQPSKLGLKAGSTIRVEDAILAVVTKSANDMAAAIGEHLAGSESRFAAKMTQRARDIGMTRTNFVNASGLHSPRQISTARDMAVLARYIIVRYPNYYRYFGTKQFTYRGKTMTNHNRLMNSYPGMDGFKTGFVNASGFNLIASAKRDGRRLIGVVFGGKSWKSRNDHMASLLNNSFAKRGSGMSYAEAKGVKTEDNIPVVNIASAKPPPVPAPKPVFRTQNGVENSPNADSSNFTSLSSLDQGRRVTIAQKIQELSAEDAAATKPEVGVTEQAMANVKTAINRGDYSELTGEGDVDAINTRRVETGLLAAAVYKGEHEKVRQMQKAAKLQKSMQQPTMQNVSIAPEQSVFAASDLWSVQIGAYTSRLATDEALRIAHSRLPQKLSHASPIVVPLNTSQGILFRARLGNLTQNQTIEACRHFRDCLPIAPR